MDLESAHVEVLIGGERAEEVMRLAAASEKEKGCSCSYEHPCFAGCTGGCMIFNIVMLVVGLVGLGLIAAKVLGGL